MTSSPGTPRPPRTPQTPQTPQTQQNRPAYADRAFRSPFGVVAGVLLLALGAWMTADAVAGGTGRTPWFALATLLLAAPLVAAFTVRPVVYASDTRMLVRNPFRTVTIPWAAVETVRAGYSSEVLAGGRKFQLWSIPVSVRARSRALRRADAAPASVEVLAPSDRAVRDLRELAERHASAEAAQGPVAVRWAYEIIAPAAAGAVLLAVLLATG